MSKVYLDYAAATPVDPTVWSAMEPYLRIRFGNPGAVHSYGQEAIAAVDRARGLIAAALGAEFHQLIFTGSATEANNLAVIGAVRSARDRTPARPPHIIVSAIEHESILEAAKEAEALGVRGTYLPVNSSGAVDLKILKENLTPETAFVSIMYANNEVGAVQDIKKLSALIKKESPQALFHTDAAQAFQFEKCDVKELGVDLLTLSAHKIYGPKGVGALFIKEPKRMKPLVVGGGQEFGLRAGTENVPGIVGFAKAVDLVEAVRARESKRLAALREELWAGIQKIFPAAELNGPEVGTLPNILNVYFPGHEAQDLLTRLDLKGLAASAGSACRSRALKVSYVLEALGFPDQRARASIRFSLGRPTTQAEIQTAVDILGETFSASFS